MGYSTDFYGSLSISRPLTEKERDYINLISNTRRMKRDVTKLMNLYKGEHGNPFATDTTPEAIYGCEGEYFAKDDNYSDSSVIDQNRPPKQQPGLWCQWVISDDGTMLEWDGGEKFYEYVAWLKYYINHFFAKWGVMLNGEITWEGEESSDLGKIVVTNNVVETKTGTITYE